MRSVLHLEAPDPPPHVGARGSSTFECSNLQHLQTLQPSSTCKRCSLQHVPGLSHRRCWTFQHQQTLGFPAPDGDGGSNTCTCWTPEHLHVLEPPARASARGSNTCRCWSTDKNSLRFNNPRSINQAGFNTSPIRGSQRWVARQAWFAKSKLI